MLTDREQLEYEMLKVLDEVTQPVGCGVISSTLQQQGRTISEATVGRMLREFDLSGYTDKTGYQGRLLSVNGKSRLEELEHKKKSVEWGVAFGNILKSRTKEDLLEVLIARRAIEGELAYLAAKNYIEKDYMVLDEIVERQRITCENGGDASEEDVEFHAYIAQIANNRILSAAIDMIRQDTQLSPILEYIRKKVHSKIYIDHQNIIEAIIKKDAEAAKKRMVEHINNIANDVEKYWEHIE